MESEVLKQNPPMRGISDRPVPRSLQLAAEARAILDAKRASLDMSRVGLMNGVKTRIDDALSALQDGEAGVAELMLKETTGLVGDWLQAHRDAAVAAEKAHIPRPASLA